ncbi:Uncharacterized conserved protein [Flaviramulus basaltis]|uniref:Uncharacterized conserved protein n=1 Tax=Flaviramulus basaltis TaxID=369401 RepID=A0A1K2ILL3_9FLAO|nr:hypothetical protein [Flaviramulus basaltis]SFZ93088.1 Uncharacterized conserved protein [Flaviramulus basaltis]
MKKYLFVSVLLLSVSLLFAQDCKVLLKTINQSYKGDCKKGKANGEGTAKGTDTYVGTFKKGLPHGTGTYSWSNGDIYNGSWEKGKKNGKGNLIKPDATVISGYWKNDDYIGLYEDPFKKLDKSLNVSSYTIKSNEGKNNVVRFYIKEDQKQIRNPDANVVVHHGNYTTVTNTSNYVELQNVNFPFKAKVYFGTNFIEFEIFNAGMWDVRTDITRIKGLGN